MKKYDVKDRLMRSEFDRICHELETLATKHEHYASFCSDETNTQLLHDYLSLLKEAIGDRYNRTKAFKRWQEREAITFDLVHKNIMKTFSLNGKELIAYDLWNEHPLEEVSTIELLASENKCSKHEIEIGYRQQGNN